MVISLLILAILVAIAIYVIQKVRGVLADEESMNDWASIEQMKDDGTLREYEYQHLRREVAPRFTTHGDSDKGVEQMDSQNPETLPD